MKKPCLVCGTLSNNPKYCSILCYGIDLSGKSKKIKCPICRTPTTNEKFCSLKCSNKYSRLFGKRKTKRTHQCPTCKKQYSTYHDNQIYCSRSCKERVYSINEYYFDNITQDNAYILGVIFSVGQMLLGYNNKILFRHKDKIIIEMISSALSSNYPIKKVGPHWEIRPSSRNLVDRLVELGFRRESKYFWFPQIPQDCKLLFIQGMMDTAVIKTKSGKIYKLVRSKELFLNIKEFGWKGTYTLSGIWTWWLFMRNCLCICKK